MMGREDFLLSCGVEEFDEQIQRMDIEVNIPVDSIGSNKFC